MCGTGNQKGVLEEFAEVQYVDYQKGEEKGFARFQTAEDAKKVVEGVNSAQKKIGEDVITCTLLEGEEETAYWTSIWAFMDASKGKRGGKSGRGGGKGGRGRGGRKPPQKRHRD